MNAVVYSMRETNSPSLTQPNWLIKAAFYKHLHECMPLLPWFASVGASIPASEFQNVTPASTTHFVVEGEVLDPSALEPVAPSTAAVENYVPETHFDAKEDRELRVGNLGQTDQFKETAFVNPHVHKRGDTPTYRLSVQQRLTPATFEDNASRKAQCLRQDMCDEYDRLVPNPPLWSPAKHEHYVDLAIEEYMSKRTEAAVNAKLRAHDPDRDGSSIVISLKNQVIKKDEKRHKKNAIPGQLIHEYDIATTLGDAAYALFLENEIIPAFPENFLFYRRMSPQQFIDKYRTRWRFNNGAYASDATRWDVGCDAGVLNFDAHVMNRSRFPKEYVDSYIQRRLSSHSQHGTMATMQNSGDRYTWPLNTVRRAVVTSIVCEVKEEDTVAVNGDDAAIDRYCHAKDFPDSPWEFKNVNGPTVEFSGFELGTENPTYSAQGLHYRTLILTSRDPSAQDKWVNYMDLLQFCPPDHPMSLDVARCAHQHMKEDLFTRYLPSTYQTHFPSLVF